MNKLMIILLAGTVSLGSGMAMAQGNGNQNGHGNAPAAQQAQNDNNCAPGKSGKDQSCGQSGQKQAKQPQANQKQANQKPSNQKQANNKQPDQPRKYSKGEKVPSPSPIQHPGHYGLKENGYYVTSGNYVYQVDKNTQKVIALVGAVADILN